MRRILLVSLFSLGLAVSAQTADSFPLGPAATGLLIVCDKSKLNNGKPFEQVDVFIRKDGTITWNDEPVTKEKLDEYIKGEANVRARGYVVYTFIGAENESPALVTKERALKSNALMLGATVPDCTPLRGPNGHLL
jgi:hypothetical protein